LLNFIIKKTRNNKDNLIINDKFIHSQYDPEKEAKNIIDRELDKNYKVIILIFPGLNYLYKDIYKQFNNKVKIISIHINEYTYQNAFKNEYSLIFNKELFNNLNKIISDFDVNHIKVIQLNSLISIFIDETKKIIDIIKNILTQKQASLNTLNYFSKRWYKNIIRNYFLDFNFTSTKTEGLHLILASGHTLLKAKELLKKIENKVTITALPSSISFLEANNIKYDFVFCTDGGYWTKKHLDNIKRNVTIFTTMTASLSLNTKNLNIIPIYQNSYIENILFDNFFNDIKNYFLFSPQLGSVALNCIDVIKKIHKGDIIIIGQDFAIKDIFYHVNPHTFDIYQIMSDKFKSYFQHKYEIFLNTKKTLIKDDYYFIDSLEIYYNWMKNNIKNEYNIYIYNNILPFNIKEITEKEILNKVIEKKISFKELKKNKVDIEIIKKVLNNHKEKSLNNEDYFLRFLFKNEFNSENIDNFFNYLIDKYSLKNT